MDKPEHNRPPAIPFLYAQTYCQASPSAINLQELLQYSPTAQLAVAKRALLRKVLKVFDKQQKQQGTDEH
jgi:hypothetical protein